MHSMKCHRMNWSMKDEGATEIKPPMNSMKLSNMNTQDAVKIVNKNDVLEYPEIFNENQTPHQ